jgi:hypothetical protein
MRKLVFCLLLAFGARAAEPPPPTAASDSWTARVHLVTDEKRVELRRLADDALVCNAPCDVDVAFKRGDFFQLKGQGLAPSDTFDFAPGNGKVRVKVNPGYRERFGAGIGVIVLGGLVVAGSLFVAVAANSDTDSRSASYGALGVGALGGLIIAGGVALMISGHSTHFKVE